MAKSEGGTAQKTLEDLEKEITCAICHEHYTDPKVLPCCHYYCKQCISRLASKSKSSQSFSCPECRKDASFPEGDVDKLSTDSNMERAQGKVEAKCELCSGDKAEAFCRQCAQFICTLCLQSHQRMKTFAGHKTTSLKDLKDGEAKEIAVQEHVLQTCKVHNEPKKIFCFDCSCLICRDCTIKDHRDHNYEFISLAAPEIKQKIIDQLEPLRKVERSNSSGVADIQATKLAIEAQEKSNVEYILSLFDELAKIIEKRKQELLAEVAEAASQKVKKLEVQEKSFSMASAVAQSVIDFTEQCVEHSADDEVMSMHTEILARIDREIQEHTVDETDLQPVEDADIGVHVSCSEDLRQLCQQKASLFEHVKATVSGSQGVIATEINKPTELEVTITKLNGRPITMGMNYFVESQLKSLVDNKTMIKGEVTQIDVNQHRIGFTPIVRGRHKLSVTVNGCDISGSPFPVTVAIPPTQLEKPIRTISNIQCVHDVAVNSATGKIFVAAGDSIVVLNANGEKLQSHVTLNSFYRGIALDSISECAYAICISNSTEVIKLSSDLKLLQCCKVNKKSAPSLTGITMAKDEVVVCDHIDVCIRVYSKELIFKRKFGSKEKLRGMRDICADEHGTFFISCKDQSCIQVFSNTGDHLRSFGSHTLHSPRGIFIAGLLAFVTDNGEFCVKVFSTDGQFVTSFGNAQGHEECVLMKIVTCIFVTMSETLCKYFSLS